MSFYNGFRGEQNADPVTAVEFLAKYCQWAVVTLGPNGCIAKHGNEVCKLSVRNIFHTQFPFFLISCTVILMCLLAKWYRSKF